MRKMPHIKQKLLFTQRARIERAHRSGEDSRKKGQGKLSRITSSNIQGKGSPEKIRLELSGESTLLSRKLTEENEERTSIPGGSRQ